MRSAIVAGIIFVIAHFAMLVGITTPEKFYFDEVHYVPAARQMLEPVMPQPMLNPMHPPLAKQLIALSIHSFGDGPLGWRYPAVLFGVARHRRGVSVRPGAVCRARSGDRREPARLLQPDAVRAVADRDAGYFCAGLQPVRHRGVHARLPQSSGRISGSRSPGSPSACRSAANGAGCSRSRSASSSSRRSA